jgi:type IV pilus assembly protein PilY1
MNMKYSLAAVAAALATAWSGTSLAQTTYSEDFTGAATANSWYFSNGACLTAGSSSNTASPGQIPSCISIKTSYYAAQRDNDLLVGGFNGVAGNAQTLPDPVGNGALRFTNGAPYGHNESGSIVSASPFNAGQGVQITFKTVTYRGDSGGAGGDGADGISFYLIDGAVTPGSVTYNGIGSTGGSLGYSCSNTNAPYDGLVGGYLGLGIDEFGNFLNGVNFVTGYVAPTGVSATGDNSAVGYGYVPGRIGLRGAGNVSWAYLNATYPAFYPTSLNATQRQNAVQATCKTGLLQNTASGTPVSTATAIVDYAPIPGAFSVLDPTIAQIANEGANSRPDGVTLKNVFFYNLEITQNGLLSFSYSMNGGAYVPVITSQSISASNGSLPATLRFGFAGSTGGDTNIHEILCFKAAPSTVSASSAAVNEKQTSQVQTTSQAYFSFYNPNDWTGRVTAYALVDTGGVVSIANSANWDSECVLTGVPSGQTCLYTGTSTPSTAEPWGSSGRQIWTWNGLDTTAVPGNRGIPFEWGNLVATQRTALGGGNATGPGATRLSYLRGDRTNEINSAGVGAFRARDGVLADIVDASPTWVGPASAPYLNTWKDRYQATGDTISENSGQSYATFLSNNQNRLNVIYAGADDGFVHGFRTGSEDSTGNVISNSSTPNDGYEVLAYMPGAVLNAIHSATSSLDYSNPQYAHNFFVDATPATGDLYYNNAWHTWLVGGLGAGGSAIYALDVTNPTSFTEANAGTLVLGEWSNKTISCTNVGNCGQNLGNTYGTPQIRRLHNGMWAVIFGNGYGSSTGDAGIYIMLIPQSTTTAPISPTFLYLSTGATSGNGIAYVSSADLDGDHITDYVYAGDLKGNVWRFDLTSTSTSSWAVSTPGPVFKAATGQPITTPVVVASAVISGTSPQVILGFGTGQRTQFTTTSATSYVTGTTQSLYGIWDWNFTAWNAQSSADYQSLTTSQASTGFGLSAGNPITQSKLQQQTFTIVSGTTNTITASNTAFTWAQCASSCSGKFGWFVNLPYTNGTTTAGATIEEQIVSPPSLFEDALVVNSTIPSNNQPLSCTSPTTDQGVTYAISLVNGGTFGAGGTVPTSSTTTFNSAFVNYRDTATVGIQTNETGSLSVVNTRESTSFLVGQDISIQAGTAPGGTQQVGLSNTSVNRLTWVELR